VRSEYPDKSSLTSTFIRLLKLSIPPGPNSIFIAFDALDECSNIDSVIDLISELKNSAVRFLCMSRSSLTELPNRLNTSARLTIEAEEQDIRNYVHTILQEKRKYADSLRVKIADRLAIDAKGK
jgi:hypothetical protein